MVKTFPYEVYALRIGEGAPIYLLVSPVRALLAAFAPDPPAFGRDLANALKGLDCDPADVRDILLIGLGAEDGPKSITAFADAWIHRLSDEKDVLAGVSVRRDATGALRLRIATRRGPLTLPTDKTGPPGATIRLD